MPDLRKGLSAAGFSDVATYVQSGNVVLSSRAGADAVANRVRRVITQRFGLDIVVLVRSEAEMAQIVRRNPLEHVASNPRRYLVTFMSEEPPAAFADDLRKVATQEPFAVIGREVYSWHPDGIGRTPLWERLARKSPSLGATSRNWATVMALLDMARDGPR